MTVNKAFIIPHILKQQVYLNRYTFDYFELKTKIPILNIGIFYYSNY